MASFDISLSTDQIEHLEHQQADIAAILNALFIPGSANYARLLLDLQREFRHGGSPDITCIAFDRVKYDSTTGKGSFRIVLDIRFTFGCEDSVTEKKDQTSEWTLVLNTERMVINFYSSPFAEDRSTADEF